MPAKPAHSECAYCGREANGRRTCLNHRDLEAVDPALQAELPPATDLEQGARTPYRIEKRAGRREVY